MKYYRISIDFGGDLDLKGKISASLLIRKMIERLSNEYETKVNSVQDTRCEIILKSDAAQDISEQLRGELVSMTGSMSCRILVELDDPEGAEGAPEAPVSPPPRPPSGSEFERRRHPAEDGAQEDGSALSKIHALVGAEEFKALADELTQMAPTCGR